MANDNDALSGYTDWKRWQADQFGRCSRGESRYFAWHLAHCHPHPIKSALELGFGNGNFKALFESIELDQIRRGVLTAPTPA